MVERAHARKLGFEQNKRESQQNPEKPVRFESTTRDNRVIESIPEHLEDQFEEALYVPRQEVHLIGLNGDTETWIVTSYNPEDESVFLRSQHDERTVPSLEFFTRKELALEEAIQPIATAVENAWEHALLRYFKPKQPQREDGLEERIAQDKGKLLRLTALNLLANHPEIFQNPKPDELANALDRELTYYILQYQREAHGDPRHTVAGQLDSAAQYYDVFSETDEVTALAEAALMASRHNAEPDRDITQALQTASDEIQLLSEEDTEEYSDSKKPRVSPVRLPTYAEARDKVNNAWSELRVQAKGAKRYLELEDPSSKKLRDAYNTLKQNYDRVKELEVAMNVARIRERSHDDTDVRKIEASDWKALMTALETAQATYTPGTGSTTSLDHSQHGNRHASKIDQRSPAKSLGDRVDRYIKKTADIFDRIASRLFG